MTRLEFGKLTASDIEVCGEAIAAIGEGAPHRQEVAQRLVGFLYDTFQVAGTKEPACVLVRCFQTCPYARLPLEYQHAAEDLRERTPSHPELRCLTLLATKGERHVWNDVATSIGHQAIPLPSVEVVRRAPMIARLLEEMGVPLEQVVAVADRTGLVVEQASSSFNVFHVIQAKGSAYIPAQEDFVERYGVESVLGMGGMLPDGEMFAVILFTRVKVSSEVAGLFRALADHVKAALLPFDASRTFETVRG